MINRYIGNYVTVYTKNASKIKRSLGEVMMTNKIIIKKIHQYFFGYLTYPQIEDNYKLIEVAENRDTENDEDFNIEVYPKIPIKNISMELYNYFNQLNKFIYSHEKITSIQVLVCEDYFSLKRGSYNLKFPYLLLTDKFEEERTGQLTEKDCQMIFFVYTELEWIEHFHKVGLSESLKQAGEIRYFSKKFWRENGRRSKKIKTSPNKLTNMAGLNVNKILFLDAIGILGKEL